MSFIDCIEKNVKENILDKRDVDKLTKRYNELKARYIQNMDDGQAAIQAANRVAEIEAEKLVQKRRNQIQHTLKWKEHRQKIESRGVSAAKYTEDLYNRTYIRKRGVFNDLVQNLEDFANEFETDFFGLKRKSDGIRDVIKEALGEDSGNAAAKDLGAAVKNTFELAHARYKAAGGIMGKIENYFPVQHRREAVEELVNSKIKEFGDAAEGRAKAKEEWVGFTINKIDINKMKSVETGLPVKPEHLQEVLEDHFDLILDGQDPELDGRIAKGLEKLGLRDPDPSGLRDASRYYKWKSADDFMDYNARFGAGDNGLYKTITGYLDSLSRDIAMMEVISPDPFGIANGLDSMMKMEGSSKIRRDAAMGAFRVISGEADRWNKGNVWWEELFYKGVDNGLGWLRSAQLGAATLSAVSDATFAVATAKANKLSSVRVMKNYFTMINPASKQDRALAQRAGILADHIMGRSISDTRFAGERMGGKVADFLSNATNKLSGLDIHTRATADAVAVEGMAMLADLAERKTAWKDLAPEDRAVFEAYDIGERDWKLIMETEAHEIEEGFKVIRARDIVEKRRGVDLRQMELEHEMVQTAKTRQVKAKKRLLEVESKNQIAQMAREKLDRVQEVIENNPDLPVDELTELYKPEMDSVREELKKLGIRKRKPETALEEINKIEAEFEDANNEFEMAVRELKRAQPESRKRAEAEVFTEAQQVASKINDWIFDMQQKATNEPTAMAKSYGTWFGKQKGTLGRAAASVVMMYKSFPITMMMTHLLPAMKKSAGGVSDIFKGDVMKGIKSQNDLAFIVIGNTLLGAVAMTAKDLSKGRNPRDWKDPKFWTASFMQGGGAGLFGDFLFADASRFNRGIIVESMGPAVGLMSDVWRATKGNMDRDINNFLDGKSKDVNYAKSMFKLAKRNIPLQSLWYGRLMFERWVLDNIERLVDPKFDSNAIRQENKFYRKTGQKSYWKKGKALPEFLR